MSFQSLTDQTPLIQAIFQNDTDIAKNLILNGDNVNAKDGEDRSPLHAAAYLGNVDIAQILIENGARVNAKDSQWRTPLHRACRNNQYDMVSLLLSHNPEDVYPIDRQWQTPLHVCAAFNCIQSAQLICEHYRDQLDRIDRSGSTALHLAAFHGQIDLVELLLSEGANYDIRDSKERRPIHWAAFGGNWDVVRMLVIRGADPTSRDKEGWTALHAAAAGGSETSAGYLLSAEVLELWPVDPNAQTNCGYTPLHVAANNGKEKVADRLIASGGAIDSTAFDGMTPLHLAAGSRDGTACTETLINSGSEINSRAEDGRQPIHIAAEYGRFARVQTLLSKGAELDSFDAAGMSPLSIAARFGHELLIRKLIKFGANVNSRGPHGLSPLHFASRQGYLDPVRTLIDNEADIKALDDDGRSALHMAAYSNNSSPGSIEYLLSANADSSQLDNYKRLPLHYAAFRANDEQVLSLLRSGCDPNQSDICSYTPTHLAAVSDQEGHCVEHLYRWKADFDKRDSNGSMPVHLAAYVGNHYTCELLLNLCNHISMPTTGRPFHLTLHHICASRGYDVLLEKLIVQFMSQARTVDQRPKSQLMQNVAMEPDFKGRIPLHFAAARGHTKCVAHLTESPRGLTAMLTQDRRGVTPLHMAAAFGRRSCLPEIQFEDRLLDSYSILDSRMRSALMFAVSSGDAETVDYFLESAVMSTGIKLIAAEDYKGRGCLHRAAAVGATALCRKLIQIGLDPLRRDEQNEWTPLHCAAANNRVDTVEFLSQFIDDKCANWSDKFGLTPIHWAAYRGNDKCLQLLLEKSKTIDTCRYSPLHCAAHRGHLECCRILLKHFGSRLLKLSDCERRTALHVAASVGFVGVIRLLLDSGAEVDSLENYGRTPLMLAISNNVPIDIVELLLDHNASISPSDMDGNTALHYACLQNLDDIGTLLVKRAPKTSSNNKIFVDMQNAKRQTPLHLAVSGGLFCTASEILLISRASLFIEDESDRLPLMSAASTDDVADCIKLVLNFMLPDWEPQNLSNRLSARISNAESDRPNKLSESTTKRKSSLQSGSESEFY